MYSVLILNQESLEIFSQFHSLFAESISNGLIGICRWNEAGTTVDEALPVLNDLTDDKEEWRAVIVRVADGDKMSAYPSVPSNPFDFLIHENTSDILHESTVPLVRLTHMLGGIPPMEVKFEPKEIQERGKARRLIYVQVENQEREDAYKALTEKYRFKGKPPRSILIITLRNQKYKEEEDISDVWLPHRESASSEFWKRNQYPGICRFIVYDYVEQGIIQNEADSFLFWLTVLILSINKIDPGTLQAYRLYSARVLLDKQELEDSFQILADRLRDARQIAESGIQSEAELSLSEDADIPGYYMFVPVDLKLPEIKEQKINYHKIPLLSKGAASDIHNWSEKRTIVEESLADSVRSAERTLDKAAARARNRSTYHEEEVTLLNQYQEEDLTRESDKIYKNIIRLQGELPSERISEDDGAGEAAGIVEELLRRRVIGKWSWILFIIMAAALIAASVPAILEAVHEPYMKAVYLGCVIIGVLAVAGLAGLICLLIQKGRLNHVVKKYNRFIRSAYAKLDENADDYSTYMSEIASRTRAQSYIHWANVQKEKYQEKQQYRNAHIKSMNALLSKLRMWTRAFHLDVDFTTHRAKKGSDALDGTAPALRNTLHAFETETNYEIDVNQSGMKMQSPYRFITKIEISREELYDD